MSYYCFERYYIQQEMIDEEHLLRSIVDYIIDDVFFIDVEYTEPDHMLFIEQELLESSSKKKEIIHDIIDVISERNAMFYLEEFILRDEDDEPILHLSQGFDQFKTYIELPSAKRNAFQTYLEQQGFPSDLLYDQREQIFQGYSESNLFGRIMNYLGFTTKISYSPKEWEELEILTDE